MSIQILPIPAFVDNYIWHIHNDNVALVVDPGDSQVVLRHLQAKQLQLSTILITHHHHDHIGGIENLIFHYPDCQVYGPARENIPLCQYKLHDGDEVNLPEFDLELQVIDVPGHTIGHIVYYSVKQSVLFCGDTLFAAGCGRVSEGTPEQMYNSLSCLANLPDDTMVYCTHEYTQANIRFAKTVESTNKQLLAREKQVDILRSQGLPSLPFTIADEKQTNPFLRCDQQTVIDAACAYSGQQLQSPVDVFAAIRIWKDEF